MITNYIFVAIHNKTSLGYSLSLQERARVRCLLSSVCTIFLIILQEKSTFVVLLNMNLHEECLLKYLLNPLDLLKSTEVLKLNNTLIERTIRVDKLIAKNTKINYTGA
mgnify:FL=1